MSAPAYTVTEGNAQGSPGWFVVRMDGEPIYESSDKKECERRARDRNIAEHAFAMLALLVESQKGRLASHSYAESWEGRREALIAKITGEQK